MGRKIIGFILSFIFILNTVEISAYSAETNLALNKTVTQSSVDSIGYEGSKTVDGSKDDSHEWYSWGRAKEWLKIDLGSTHSINKAVIYWGAGYASGYKLQGSSDGTKFTDIPGTIITKGTGGTITINFTDISYRYVRLYTTTVPTSNYGHEVLEFEIYGAGETPAGNHNYPNNVIYMPHGFFCTQKTDAFILSALNEVQSYSFNYVMCNVGSFVESDGTMPSSNYTDSIGNNMLVKWVKLVHAKNPDIKIIAYVNGTQTLADNVTAHTNMVNVCEMLVNTFGCDGVHLNFEPLSHEDAIFLSLMKKIKTRIGNKHLSVAGPVSEWTSPFITQVANSVDMICTMNYDMNCSKSDFLSDVKASVIKYSKAMKGTNCQLIPLQAAYSSTSIHNIAVENIENTSVAIDQSVTEGSNIYGSGIWWWYEMTAADKKNWTTKWVR
ncbi:discoidin domain-containing protein [Clostridium vincentii]|uniref:F5/8 type C domain protein n=1 Tax=Clostridium vincentii TaxID=52704 RepID=A0A2T0BCX2_9CLOT|nr:discoidin domain-containing protein [Clostridium vincentii]PRR81695.1 F5/8 type C domain protein [Clostridium vincentii]